MSLYETNPDAWTEAYRILCVVTGHAARSALGAGLNRSEVAAELAALADAIADPGSVAENMSPLPQITAEKWQQAGVDFTEWDENA